MTLGPLMRKEIKIILRSRLLLVVLVLYPVVIVGIIGFAFSEPNQKVPIALVNQDLDARGEPNREAIADPVTGQPSAVFVSSADLVRGLKPFAVLQETRDEETALHWLKKGEVQAVVVFPINFVRDIVNYQSSGRMTIILDKSDPVRATSMEVVIRGVVQKFQETIVKEKVKIVVDVINTTLREDLRVTDPLYPGFRRTVDFLKDIRDKNLSELRDKDGWHRAEDLNQSIEFLETVTTTLERSRGIVNSVAEPVGVNIRQEASGSLFIRDLVVPAALGLSIFWTGSLATSSLVVYEREAAAYSRLRITPATAGTIYGSKILITFSIILGQALLILIAAVVSWGTRIDNLLLTLFLIVVSAGASMALGLFVAGISRDVNGTVLLSVLVTFPMLFLSGLFYPVDFMPEGAQVLAHLFPLTYTVEGLRGAMLRGFGFGVAQTHILALLAFAVGLTLAGVAMGKRLESRR